MPPRYRQYISWRLHKEKLHPCTPCQCSVRSTLFDREGATRRTTSLLTDDTPVLLQVSKPYMSTVVRTKTFFKIMMAPDGTMTSTATTNAMNHGMQYESL